MKCHEAKRHLDLFMDGELSVQENMKVLEHLNLCRDCSGIYEGEKALRSELKQRVGSEKAPEGMMDRIVRGLGTAPVAPFARRPWGAKVAAALFFAVFLGALVFTPSGNPPEAVAAELAERHDVTRDGYGCVQHPDRICLCESCCPDDQLGGRIDGFFAGHGLEQVCHHPELERMGYRFSGVAVWPQGGARVFWSVLGGEGGAISHGLLTIPMALPDGPSTVDCGKRVVLFKPRGDRPGVTCVFIFDGRKQANQFLVMAGR